MPDTLLTPPLCALRQVTHVGTLDPADKGNRGPSQEGAGLSFSTEPAAWVAIARLGGSSWWRADLTGLRLLDGHACLEQKPLMDAWRAWAQEEGLIVPVTFYRATWFDDEMDQTLEAWCATREEAEDEAGDPESVEPVEGWCMTERMTERLGYSLSAAARPTPLLDQHVATVWGEDHGFDGVWWSDTLDVSRYSAPRGVLFAPGQAKVQWRPALSPSAPSPRRRTGVR